MGQSGSTMAWQFATQTNRQVDPCPEMLTYIEDRDLWRFAFGEKTKRFSAALRTYEQAFDIWDGIACDPKELVVQGKDILRAHQKNVKQITEHSFPMSIKGHDVPCCNAPYHYASDVAHELLQKFPDAPFAACWFMRDDKKMQFSLRSENRPYVSSAPARRAVMRWVNGVTPLVDESLAGSDYETSIRKAYELHRDGKRVASVWSTYCA
jgi:hypothetical protein